MTAWTQDDQRAVAIALRRLARGHTELLRQTTPCDACGASPADSARVVTGRTDGMLCRICWWTAVGGATRISNNDAGAAPTGGTTP
jgi:hypothetical protein